MNETTYNRRTEDLIKEVTNHPYKDELLRLCEDQLKCDRNKLLVPYGHSYTN